MGFLTSQAAIQRFPDGTFEIHVPQTLTPEQEQYEFPPRSRLLKKLASATAERRRVSLTLLEDDNNSHMPPPPPPIPAPHAKKPDQHAMDEWFSSCNGNNATTTTTTTTRRKQTRRGSIFDTSSFTTCNNSSYINNVQQHRPLVPSPTTHCRHPTQQNYAKNVTMAPLQSITGKVFLLFCFDRISPFGLFNEIEQEIDDKCAALLFWGKPLVFHL